MKKMIMKKITHKKLLFVLITAVVIAGILIGSAMVRDNSIKKLMLPLEAEAFSYAAASDLNSADSAGFSDLAPAAEMMKAAETDALILFRTEKADDICIYDKRSGESWYAVRSGKNDPVVEFDYVSLSSKNPTVLTESNLLQNTCNVSAIPNGFAVEYFFESLGIGFTLQYTLVGNVFSVYCPDDLIRENAHSSPERGEDAEERMINAIASVTDRLDRIHKTLSADGDELLSNYAKTVKNNVDARFITLNDQIKLGNYNTQIFDSVSEDIGMLRSFCDKDSIMKACDEIDGLLVTIRECADQLVNSRSMALVSVSPLPWFGSCTCGTDGYAFYPDGDGAISGFEKVFPHSVGIYEQPVYDNLDPYYSTAIGVTPEKYISAARMPVFGVKKNHAAFLAVIAEGDTDSEISYRPIIEENGTSQIKARCLVRTASPLALSSGVTIKAYSEQRNGNSVRIDYRMLSGNDADYNGMARSYRKYLDEQGLLPEKAAFSEEMPLLLDFMIGAQTHNGSLLNGYVCMTGFSEIPEYLDRLRKDGINDVIVRISSWTDRDSTLSDTAFSVSKKAGGIKGFNRLRDYCEKNGVTLIADCDLVTFREGEVSGAVSSVAPVKNMSGIAVASDEKEGLFNTRYLYRSFFRSQLAKGNTGLCFGQIGRALWFDFNELAPMSRRDTAAVLRRLTADYKGTTALSCPNAYLFGETRLITDLPANGSGYYFTTLEVPFYQMALHGSTLLFGEAFNRFSDAVSGRAKAISRGCLPSYYLTSRSSLALMDTDAESFYNTELEKWYSDVVETYAFYKKTLASVYGEEMNAWSVTEEGLYRTEFTNGTILYTNPGTETVTRDGLTVEGGGCTVVKGAAS